MEENTGNVIAWLNRFKREQFIGIYNHLKEKQAQIQEILFVNHVETANLRAKELEEQYGTAFDWEVENPGEIYERIMDEAAEFYRHEVLMEHNHHLMMLSNMYQIFEQQIRSFIYEELNNPSNAIKIKVEYKDFGLKWDELKEAYSVVGFDFDRNPFWEDIKVLKDIVNTFKHGEGNSSKRLLKRNPDYFLKSDFDDKSIMESMRTTNFEVVFDVEKIDFNHYADAIIGFWREMPEYLEGAYSFGD